MRNLLLLVIIQFCAVMNLQCLKHQEKPTAKTTDRTLDRKPYIPVLVGFYNCENFFDTVADPHTNDDDFTPRGSMQYNSWKYRDKTERLATVIGDIGKNVSPDGLAVLGVAEVENAHVLRELCNHPKLAKRDYRIVHFDSRDARGIDVGLLYQGKYFRVLDKASFPVLLHNTRKQNYSSFYTRDILWVKGVFLSQDTVHFFVVHMPSRRGGQEASAPLRKYHASLVRKLIDSIRAAGSANEKMIVMGDMNDNPDNASIVQSLGAKADKENLQGGHLYNPFAKIYRNGQGTLAFRDTWNLFDQMIVSASLLQKSGLFLHQARIFDRNYLREELGQYRGYPKRSFVGNRYNYGYSDHFPVYLILLREK